MHSYEEALLQFLSCLGNNILEQEISLRETCSKSTEIFFLSRLN